MEAKSRSECQGSGFGRQADCFLPGTQIRTGHRRRLDGQAMTSLGTTGGQNGTTTTRTRTDEETMGTLATDNGGLVSAFHDSGLTCVKINVQFQRENTRLSMLSTDFLC